MIFNDYHYQYILANKLILLDIFDNDGNYINILKQIQLPTPITYKWDITDKQTIADIKKCTFCFFICKSNIWSIWNKMVYMELYLNGSRLKRNGAINVIKVMIINGVDCNGN